jgi:hypothetical protein
MDFSGLSDFFRLANLRRAAKQRRWILRSAPSVTSLDDSRPHGHHDAALESEYPPIRVSQRRHASRLSEPQAKEIRQLSV